MRINFQEISITAEKSVKCLGCGKRLKRRKKFWQTLNPFNKLEDGTVKTREDIMPELQKEAKEWRESLEFCTHCKENR